jgi:hypothetical protein
MKMHSVFLKFRLISLFNAGKTAWRAQKTPRKIQQFRGCFIPEKWACGDLPQR